MVEQDKKERHYHENVCLLNESINIMKEQETACLSNGSNDKTFKMCGRKDFKCAKNAVIMCEKGNDNEVRISRWNSSFRIND